MDADNKKRIERALELYKSLVTLYKEYQDKNRYEEEMATLTHIIGFEQAVITMFPHSRIGDKFIKIYREICGE